MNKIPQHFPQSSPISRHTILGNNVYEAKACLSSGLLRPNLRIGIMCSDQRLVAMMRNRGLRNGAAPKHTMPTSGGFGSQWVDVPKSSMHRQCIVDTA